MRLYRELRFILMIIFVVFGIRSFTYDHYHIPSGSLLPTNAIGDHILVDKMAYGIKYPFSEYINSFYRYLNIKKEYDSKYITKQILPKRGDIVVFEYPRDRDTLYVKRTIAIEGDFVEIRGNGVFVNNQSLNKKIVKDDDLLMLFSNKDKLNIRLFEETNDDKKYIIAHNQQFFTKKGLKKVLVPKDHIFVLGDNRDHSLDSRYWGFVHKKLIRGKAIKVLFSLEVQYNPLNMKFRPKRSGINL